MSRQSVALADRADVESEPAYVEADLNYIVPMTEKPRSYTYEPPPGIARMNATYEPHRVRIRNARLLASDTSLDREGFRLVRHHSAVRDFDSEDELKRVYYPEAERVVAEATGANRVIVFDHTIRRRVPGVADRTAHEPRQPVPRVHNDYTEKSGPQRVRDLMGPEAEKLLRGRYSVVNLWRPIRGPLRDAPLAICDARSIPFEDFVPSDLIYRDRTGETYAVRYNASHRWFYAPAMEVDEAFLIKCFDSAKDGRARFSPHSAFEDPTAPAGVLPRESIEIRTLIFYPD
ncbi:MAG TPA: CmcJ/NvfI family oxidoreductase [Alphaproteobacteria bacterium]|nr:CmcJ/NvfI family oxidoreductase [Alphaproteobacteria bacterium]